MANQKNRARTPLQNAALLLQQRFEAGQPLAAGDYSAIITTMKEADMALEAQKGGVTGAVPYLAPLDGPDAVKGNYTVMLKSRAARLVRLLGLDAPAFVLCTELALVTQAMRMVHPKTLAEVEGTQRHKLELIRLGLCPNHQLPVYGANAEGKPGDWCAECDKLIDELDAEAALEEVSGHPDITA